MNKAMTLLYCDPIKPTIDLLRETYNEIDAGYGEIGKSERRFIKEIRSLPPSQRLAARDYACKEFQAIIEEYRSSEQSFKKELFPFVVARSAVLKALGLRDVTWEVAPGIFAIFDYCNLPLFANHRSYLDSRPTSTGLKYLWLGPTCSEDGIVLPHLFNSRAERKNVHAHVRVMQIAKVKVPHGKVIAHLNGIGLDNRHKNLIVTTDKMNAAMALIHKEIKKQHLRDMGMSKEEEQFRIGEERMNRLRLAANRASDAGNGRKNFEDMTEEQGAELLLQLYGKRSSDLLH